MSGLELLVPNCTDGFLQLVPRRHVPIIKMRRMLIASIHTGVLEFKLVYYSFI
jgi:hypothetical protein